jgi:hypothetical protein
MVPNPHSRAAALLALALASWLCMLSGCASRAAHSRQPDSTPTVDFCDLLRDPAKYEGMKVTVRASLRTDFEYDEVFCMNCLALGRTWPEFVGEDAWEGPKRPLRKLPSSGIVTATFDGVFESRTGAYGHMNLYRFQFRVTSMRDVSVIYRGSTPPQRLPPEIQAKFCH